MGTTTRRGDGKTWGHQVNLTEGAALHTHPIFRAPGTTSSHGPGQTEGTRCSRRGQTPFILSYRPGRPSAAPRCRLCPLRGSRPAAIWQRPPRPHKMAGQGAAGPARGRHRQLPGGPTGRHVPVHPLPAPQSPRLGAPPGEGTDAARPAKPPAPCRLPGPAKGERSGHLRRLCPGRREPRAPLGAATTRNRAGPRAGAAPAPSELPRGASSTPGRRQGRGGAGARCPQALPRRGTGLVCGEIKTS